VSPVPAARPLRLSKYVAAARVAARQAAVSRVEWIGRAGFYAVLLLVFSRLWKVAIADAAGTPSVARDLLWYLAVTEWVLLSIPTVHLDVERDVRSGDVAYLLPRPMSYLGLRVSEAIGTLLVRLATLALVGGPCAFLLAGGGPSDPRGLVVALALGPFAGVLAILFQAAIGVTAVWLHDVSPIYWIWQKAAFVLGGLVLPLHLYPDWLQAAARWTPFAPMLYGPGRAAMGFDPAAGLRTAAEIAAWWVVGVVGLRWLSGRALRVLDVNGG
jgi:ABC-2 type transport system permease protein